jgi:hypothetical protein
MEVANRSARAELPYSGIVVIYLEDARAYGLVIARMATGGS